MKPQPEEIEIHNNFKPGGITKDGFLGSDARHVHDIVGEDGRTLAQLGIDPEAVADRLQYFIEEGKKGLENTVDLGDFTVQVRWQRGMLPCPFGEKGLHHKLIATVYHKKMDRSLRYSQLNVHMIREHGFFEGKSSIFRLDPEEVVDILGISSKPERMGIEHGLNG
ncbi:MAG: hypothetical protein ABIL68_00230 [bacterium]